MDMRCWDKFGDYKYIAVSTKDPRNFESEMNYGVVYTKGNIPLLKSQFEFWRTSGIIKCITGEWPVSIWNLV